VVVLVPAVPLLAISVAALAVFYSMPTRFNAWLSRLPGDDLLRTALIFAPATLLAIIVMAVLYANDAPRRQAVEATRPSRRRQTVRARQRGGLARASLAITVPALMLVATAHLVAFVAPERMERLLQALPATGLLTRLFGISPYVVLAAVGIGLLLGFVPGRAAIPEEAETGRGWTTARVARLGALLILVPSLGLLLLTGAGLVWVSVSAESLAWLAERLPAETLLRLGLMFSPAMLLGLVLLAGLFLAAPPRGERADATSQPLDAVPIRAADGARPDRRDRPQAHSEASSQPGLRSGLALGVLVVGLGFTALAGMATLVAVIFVLAAR
jgi:hypothetical protein